VQNQGRGNLGVNADPCSSPGPEHRERSKEDESLFVLPQLFAKFR